MSDNETNGHYYIPSQQGPAICGYCNNCNEPKCCPQGECERTVLNEINEAIKRVRKMPRFNRAV